MRILLVLGQHLDRAHNRQSSANQRKKLLVENEKGLQLDLALRASAKTALGFDGKDVVAGVNKAGAQFFGSGCRLHLLLYATALVGHFDYEFRHAPARRLRSLRLFPANFPSIQGTSSRPLFS